MTKKEKRALYMKSYQEANKDKLKAYREARKVETKNYNKTYREDNQGKLKATRDELRSSEGIGVYKATYPSGVYIGSGFIWDRKKQHLSGNSRIAKTLKEKALSFEVVSLCNNKNHSLEVEQVVIHEIGLDNLLNVNNIKYNS